LTELNELYNFRQHSQALSLESTATRNVDIMVENFGRVNFGIPSDFLFQKGLHEGSITIDGEIMNQIEIMALEFKGDWVRG